MRWSLRTCSALALIGFSPLAWAQASVGSQVAASDLAVILPADAEPAASILAKSTLAPARPLFEASWYDALRKAYESTPVGSALDAENSFDDWRLVSFRVVPCAPLGHSLAVDADTFCWPETRLVWQPVQKGILINGHVNVYFADDRAAHALYDVAAASVLPASDATEADALLAKARAQATGQGPALDGAALQRFTTLRDEVARRYLKAALEMRDPGLSSASYAQLGPRPEYPADAARLDPKARAFRARMATFLTKFAPTERVKELTSFSLPEGRQPPLLDEWVFVQFEGRAGRLVQRDIELRSSIDGRLLFNFGKSAVGTQRRDDPALHSEVDAGRLSDADRQEVENAVMLFASDKTRLRDTVADRRRTLVPNTSCASCHKMNGDPFDFHNLSYLDDRPMAVTPRVKRDVELDLDWARARL